MATIKPIEGRTVHQIQSGQVIVDLCSVVKELVENSLDAGATNIDVRFKSQGLDSIEVQDNGDGISAHNHEKIALKHYTSKLSTYDDLTTLQTFGFRGEALSSLCALSRFSIITCIAQDAPKGTKLQFEISGKLKSTSVVAAQKGTTVVVEHLFNNLPVRRRELERNIKREWNRVIGVLGQYACIQTGIKFSVSHQPTKGKKTSIFSTKGNQSTRENIANVFGAKTLTALVPLDLKLELELTRGLNQKSSIHEDKKKDIQIVGHISRPASGEGRQAPDRQMFFVNARPCGLPQVAKAFNEVYKSYNASQSPFIFANIELDTHLYDVNVSPDKRTILLHDQTQMLENLKTALAALFDTQDYTVPISQVPALKQPSFKQLTFTRESALRVLTPQTPIEPTEEEELEVSSQSGCSTDEDSPRKSFDASTKRGTEPKEPLNRDDQASNLISNWIGRNSENQSNQKSQPAVATTGISVNLSKENRALIKKLTSEGQQQQNAHDSSEDDGSSVPTSQSSQFTSTTTRVIAATEQQTPEPQSMINYDAKSRLESQEPPIPALRSPSKLSSTVPYPLSSSRMPPRDPAEIATITIGDHTVTSSIGTPRLKRSRIEDPTSVKLLSPDAPTPSFGSRLSQRFAAPGTQPRMLPADDFEPDSHDDYDDDDADSSSSVDNFQQTESGVGDDQDGADPASSQIILKEEPDSSLLPNPDVDEDAEYVNEDEKKAQEDAKVQEMIKVAEESTAQPPRDNALRVKGLLKGGPKKKDMTLKLVRILDSNVTQISERIRLLDHALSPYYQPLDAVAEEEALDSGGAEEKLSLTIAKTDFANMKIIGQFNLGFILALRPSEAESECKSATGDELFIIDQHASDEKYNFERLQATTIVQSQKLVYPKILDLTAVEEEIVIENLQALETNGFIVTVDETGNAPVGKRCQLVSLPLSRETTFTITDLEELLALLIENPLGTIPRPSKVRKMFAMRACRSSIMIGRTLTHRQMGKVVKHLGELDKPWNCPHGRPTMRHLCGFGVWDDSGWKEGDSEEGKRCDPTDWAAYVRQNRGGSAESAPP